MKSSQLMLIPFFGLFFAVGLGLLGWAIYSTQRSLAAAHWPTVPGKLVSADLKDQSDSDGSSYRVVVKYEYSVNGVPFTGDRIAFGYSGNSGRAAHQQILDRLRAAKSVLVRYAPNDPKTSVLSFGIHRSIIFIYAFALVWLMFISGMAFMFWMSSRPDNVLLDNLGVR